MTEEFTLTSPGPRLNDLRDAAEVVNRITQLGMTRRARRPLLGVCCFRIEKRLHKKLAEASKKIDPLGQSDILNGALEIILPLILQTQGSIAKNASPDQPQFEQIGPLIAQLQELLKSANA